MSSRSKKRVKYYDQKSQSCEMYCRMISNESANGVQRL